jgi:hypothetical protein
MSFVERAPRLTEDEFEALTRAGTWYANYFAREIAAEAQQSHAYAVEERRSYLALVSGLRKLGVLYALPDELSEHRRQAA